MESFPTVTESTQILMGCDPQMIITVESKTDGSIFFNIVSADDTPIDIDGFFFNLADDSTAGNLNLYPGVNTLGLTDFEANADSEDTLSNGAQLAEQYDVKLQFGTVEDSTEGNISEMSFVLFTDDGAPLTLDDIDLTSFAGVVNSDIGDGKVLLVDDEDDGDGDGDDDDVEECSFLIEGDVNVQVTLTQIGDQDVEVSLSVLGGDDEDATGQVGDLRGFFFNVSDDSLLNGLTVSGGDVTDSQFSANGVNNLGNGANVNGGGRSEFDGGVEIGRQGIGKGDDIQETTFTLSNLNGLSISDFSGEDFALRLTSVGEADGNRDNSLKLEGECVDSTPPPPEDCTSEYSLEDVMSLMTAHVPEEDTTDVIMDDGFEEEEFNVL